MDRDAPKRHPETLPFLIRRDGSWLYRGSPISRKPMICLFATALRRDAEGHYRLETPAERGRIEVEDAPFLAVELQWSGTGRGQVLSFRLNTDEVVCAGPDHALQTKWQSTCSRSVQDGCPSVPVPYLTVRPGDGAFPVQARVSRAVYYELVALAVEGHCDGERCLGVWSAHCFFPLGIHPDLVMDAATRPAEPLHAPR